MTPTITVSRRPAGTHLDARCVIRTIAVAELTYGIAFVLLLATGFAETSAGSVVVALGVTVAALVAIGGAAAATARRLTDTSSAALAAVTANAVLTVAGILLLIGGCQSFSATTGALVLGIVAAGALSAATIAVAREFA